jgi:hypothetical protein
MQSARRSLSWACLACRCWEKLSAAERSSLNQALAKALALRDAGEMPEAREWAAEIIRLLKSHGLLK